MKKLVFLMIVALVLALSGGSVFSQVLGACGTKSENAPAPPGPPPQGAPPSMEVHPLLLPGQRAINFELPAVVGDEIKMVKLSDYNGMWRVVCFYPADFTFV